MSRPGMGAGDTRRVVVALVAVLTSVAAAGRAARAGGLETIAGWQGDSHGQGYGFVALGALLPARDHLVVPARVSGSFLYYRYDSAGTTIRVTAPGASLTAGIRVTGARGSASVLGGGEVRREHRELSASGGPARVGTTAGVVVQVDGDLAPAPRWRGFLFGNYAGAAQYFYGQGAVRYQVTNLDWKGATSVFVGAEGVRQGNDESDAFQGGGFVEWNLVPQRLSLGLHGGYRESWSPGESHRRGGYLGVSIYHAL